MNSYDQLKLTIYDNEDILGCENVTDMIDAMESADDDEIEDVVESVVDFMCEAGLGDKIKSIGSTVGGAAKSAAAKANPVTAAKNARSAVRDAAALHKNLSKEDKKFLKDFEALDKKFNEAKIKAGRQIMRDEKESKKLSAQADKADSLGANRYFSRGREKAFRSAAKKDFQNALLSSSDDKLKDQLRTMAKKHDEMKERYDVIKKKALEVHEACYDGEISEIERDYFLERLDDMI